MRLGNETVDPCSPRHVRILAVSSRCFLPRFSESTGVWKSHQARFWGSICPLVHQMRRKKIARKISSPRVRSLLQCGRFTSCYASTYGMTLQRTIHRKTAKAIVIRAWAMHEIRPSDEKLIIKTTDERRWRRRNDNATESQTES
jgi:hypothetical protein